MTITVETEGFAELERNLDRLTKAAGKGVLRRSLKKAAEPMIAIAQAKTPVKSGALAGSITVSTRLAKSQSGSHRRMFQDQRASIEMFLGPSYDLGAGGRHAHLVEFGTPAHTNGGKFAGSQHPGTAPQPFMRPAWSQDQKSMLERLSDNLWTEIQKSIARAERKAARAA